MSGHPVEIVGAGLVGSLLSVFLARRGCRVTVRERRADPRSGRVEAGRSINLVITERGFHALRQVGLEDGARELTVRVRGRMVHAASGALSFQPYGRDETECNYSISRADLNRFLIDRAERAGVRFVFGQRLAECEPRRGRLVFAGEAGGEPVELEAPTVIGADGGGSVLRAGLVREAGIHEALEPLSHGYKELEIPPAPGGAFRLDGDALHIWPRGDIMLMALPNRDGSFTVTLYLPHAGPSGFAGLDSPAAVERLFAERFADALPLIPDLARNFLARPTGQLGTVRCRPWHLGGWALLVGDAAHGIVPFFGQGMNCGFEDCTILAGMLGASGPIDWAATFAAFSAARKPDADAIADMALENFVEMRDRVGDPAFLLRKAVEHALEQERPSEYRTRYALVMYTRRPYREAREIGRIQDAILDRLCTGLSAPERLDRELAWRLVRERLAGRFAER